MINYLYNIYIFDYIKIATRMSTVCTTSTFPEFIVVAIDDSDMTMPSQQPPPTHKFSVGDTVINTWTEEKGTIVERKEPGRYMISYKGRFGVYNRPYPVNESDIEHLS